MNSDANISVHLYIRLNINCQQKLASFVEVFTRVAESEVFGWNRSWIHNNTGSRIFLSDSDFGCPIGSLIKSRLLN